MNIAILGGRFDPPHLGHYWVARQILERGPQVSEVWFVPVNIHAWKKAVVESRQRLEMVRFFEEERLKISSIEIERPGISYTIDTIKYLKENYKQDNFFWIVGSDALADFSNWRQSQKLAVSAPFIVFPRGGYPIKMLPLGMKKINGEGIIETNLSSTHIRERIKRGLPIKGMVTPEVEKYIREKKLYI